MASMTLTQGKTANGGAIQMTTQTLNLSNMDFNNNSATTSGGAIAVTTGSVFVTNSTFEDNVATTSGGAIHASSTATLNIADSQIIANTSTSDGGAIFINAGTLAISKVIFDSNRGSDGGAIYSSTDTTSVDIQKSYFINNVAAAMGGAVYMAVKGTLTIANTTLESNTALATGSSGGGAIQIANGLTTITNSTFTKNVTTGAGGAIRSSSSGTLNVFNSTIVGNTASLTGDGAGGIHFTGTTTASFTKATLENTIVAANTGYNGPDVFSPGATSLGFAIAGNNNLIGYGHVSVDFSGINNQIGNRTPIDPGVNALANNGGFTLPDGSTIRTMSLKSTSPAIDKGASTTIAFDQRDTGFTRNRWFAVDIGAFEYTPPVAPTAVGVANTVTTGGGTTFDVTVTFTDDVNVDAGTVDAGDVVVKSYVGGVTHNATGVVVTPPSGLGNPVTAVFTFNAPVNSLAGWDASDQDLYEIYVAGTVTDGTNSVVAGKIRAFGEAFAPVSLLVDEATDVDDGKYGTTFLSLREAVMLANGNLNQVDSITFNLPSGTTITLGSHLMISDRVNITGPGADKLTIDANKMGRHFTLTKGGMAVSINAMKLVNGFAPYGGSIQWTSSDTLSVDSVWFDGNFATYGWLTWSGGGAIGAYSPSSTSGNVSVKNSTFSNNSATLYGGAIALMSGNTFTISNSTFSNNKALHGGAIGGPMSSGTVSIKNSTITNNTAGTTSSETGGGIFMSDSTNSIGILSIESSIVAGNSGGTAANTAPDIRGYTGVAPWYTIKNSIIGKHTHGNYTDVGGTSFVGSVAVPVDPLLLPLGNYGGDDAHACVQGRQQGASMPAPIRTA